MSKRNRLYHRWLGPVAVWAGRSDYEHPSRWAGCYVPRIGEIELHLTSARVHSHEPRRTTLDVWADISDDIVVPDIGRFVRAFPA